MKSFSFVAFLWAIVLTSFVFPFTTHAQCPTTSYCLNSGSGIFSSSFSQLSIPAATSGSSYTTIVNGATNSVAPHLDVTNAGCTTQIISGNSVTKQVDMRINVLNVLSDGVTLDPSPDYGPKFATPSGNGIRYNGTVGKYYKFTVSFFESGTNVPLALNALQQVSDIDGDGDINFDGIIDNPNPNSHPTPKVDPQVWDESLTLSTTAFDGYQTTASTFIYSKVNGLNKTFYSSGSDNPNIYDGVWPAQYSGITGIPAPSSMSQTQTIVLGYLNRTKAEFTYYTGQFTGIYLDFSAQGYLASAGCTPVPLKWLNVKGRLNHLKQTQLSWDVSEQNVVDYRIEKSSDGYTFQSIGKLAGKGNGENNYGYTENSILQDKAYYRIKQTDNDGRYSYSSIIAISNQEKARFAVYPTDVTDGVMVYSQSTQQARFFNTEGKIIKTILLTSGTNHIDCGNLAAGVYVVATANGDNRRIIKR
ncbi:MAG: hypothetical protein JNL23_04675 [Chitinophagaceae bacterium]|nr:hypothetical protein [Chitinophagaceae bacterium]